MKLLLVRHAGPDHEHDSLTEKGRREGIAYFRMLEFGDISHLYANGETPSFILIPAGEGIGVNGMPVDWTGTDGQEPSE